MFYAGEREESKSGLLFVRPASTLCVAALTTNESKGVG